MWSLGCCLYEMLTLSLPFAAENMDQLYQVVTKGAFDPIARHFSADATKVLKVLLTTKPEKRVSCQQLIHMPFFRNRVNQFMPDYIEGKYESNHGFNSNAYGEHEAVTRSQLLKTIRLGDGGIFRATMAK